MLKVNLEKESKLVNLRPLKPFAALFLIFSFIWQFFSYYQQGSELLNKQAEIEMIKSRLTSLREKKNSLAVVENFEALNGAVAARNEWLRLREKSPVFVLAKLEKEKPGAVELKSFESSDTGGTIRLMAGDMDTASRFMNAVFGNNNIRLSLEERIRTGILAACTWTE